MRLWLRMKQSDREYLSRVAGLCCILCRRLGYGETPAEVHHQRTGTGAGKRASHKRVMPLCPEHHRGQSGLHGMGRRAFERRYEVTELELIDEVRKLLGEKE